ncbi:MAG: ion transporter [Hyphomonadaceae bacterium]|nr:ion transporter [Hyphomonadaceae bacterium]
MSIQHTMTQLGFRKRLYLELEPDARDSSGLSRTNLLIVLLVVASFIALALETEPSLSEAWRQAIVLFNYAIVAIFAVEYVIRLWAAGEDERYRGLGGRGRYMMTPSALADLIAFLPELLWLIFMGGQGEEALMILRVLRLSRLVKIARFMPAFDILGAAISRSGGQLFTTLAVALMLVYLSAVVLYFIEGVGAGRAEFGSIPRAVWWAIATLTTVGYGDVYPETTLGRIAASVIALAGIGVVALPAGVFASAFSDELRARDEARKEQEARRAAMGLTGEHEHGHTHEEET